MKKLVTHRILPALFVIMLVVSSCQKGGNGNSQLPRPDEHSSEVVTAWMDLILEMTRTTPGFSPPVAARAFGYAGLGLYESVRGGQPGYKTLAGQVSGLSQNYLPKASPNGKYHWPAVANATLATIARGCYVPAALANEQLIDDLELAFNNEFQSQIPGSGPGRSQGLDAYELSVAFGIEMGEKILDYAMSDNQDECYKNNFPTSYTAPTGNGLWVPTPPAYQRALQPYWGDVRPFLAQNVSSAVQPGPPPPFSMDGDSYFFKECKEVYDVVNAITSEELKIAKYWSDDPGLTATPPGHSLSILRQVLIKEDADLLLAAEAFAKLGMGVHDAFISCWRAKFDYNLVRPITLIRQHFDASFTTPLTTPPFPEYTSGHSVQSGAASLILTDLFGSHYSFTDYTHQNRTDIDGTPRYYSSFYDFADEAAISRLYGGIHFRAAIENGIVQGRLIGNNISALKFK
ncbi:MAG: phosphoesterase [Bacteroidia bacterium]